MSWLIVVVAVTVREKIEGKQPIMDQHAKQETRNPAEKLPQ